MSIYAVRRGPFEKAASFRLSDGQLIQSTEGKADKVWALHHLRRIRLAAGTNRYVAGERVAILTFRKGVLTLPSHSFEALGHYADQRKSFVPFVREICREAADVTPPVKFEAGAPAAAGVFTGAIALIGVGVALLLLAAFGAGAPALGADLGARLAFILMLMFAVQPWLTSAGPRRFDPRSIPPDVLS